MANERADVADRLIDAAILWAMCPKSGGYKYSDDTECDDSIEGTCEALAAAVDDYLGLDPGAWDDREWTVAEMRAAVVERMKTMSADVAEVLARLDAINATMLPNDARRFVDAILLRDAAALIRELLRELEAK